MNRYDIHGLGDDCLNDEQGIWGPGVKVTSDGAIRPGPREKNVPSIRARTGMGDPVPANWENAPQSVSKITLAGHGGRIPKKIISVNPKIDAMTKESFMLAVQMTNKSLINLRNRQGPDMTPSQIRTLLHMEAKSILKSNIIKVLKQSFKPEEVNPIKSQLCIEHTIHPSFPYLCNVSIYTLDKDNYRADRYKHIVDSLVKSIRETSERDYDRVGSLALQGIEAPIYSNTTIKTNNDPILSLDRLFDFKHLNFDEHVKSARATTR